VLLLQETRTNALHDSKSHHGGVPDAVIPHCVITVVRPRRLGEPPATARPEARDGTGYGHRGVASVMVYGGTAGQRCRLGAETQRILPLRLEMARHRQDHIQRKRRVVYGGQRCFKHPLTVSSGHGQEQGLAHGQLSFIDWPDRLTDAGSGHRLNGRMFWQRYEKRASVVFCAVQRQHSHTSRTTLTASPSHLRFAARRLRRDGPPGWRGSASVALLLQPTRGVRMGDAHADNRCHRLPASSQPA
jgi:hypothetical protein